MDQQFIEYIVKSLVGKPDAVKVDRRIDEKGVLLELIVDPEDLGRVIGKRGSTAQSLRTLLRALGTKNDARYNLKIVDTGPPPEKREQRTENREQTPEEEPVPVAVDKPADLPSAATDDVDMADEDELPEKPREDTADVISRTRKELEELDDLDV
ncbi:KH domain-containing protein [Candidatus Saccharibacteria bacterium]|nr:KH domain-containing protein [Candidatus Saccharibacteria bacterium]